MAKNLKEIDKSPISYYILTNNIDVVKHLYADTGNVIIYTGHNGDYKVDNKDAEANISTYTDLYIGDEHIAGGFGFRNSSERNFAYDVIFNKFPQLQNDVSKIEFPSESESENTNQQSSITVDGQYKHIKTEDAKYTLDLDETTGILSILTEEKERLSNFESFSTYNGVFVSLDGPNKTNFVELGEDFKLSYVTFEYIGNEEILGFYISAFKNNNQDIKTSTTIVDDICGTQEDFISINDLSKPAKAYNQYMLVDPDFNPQQICQKWKIEFTNEFMNLLNDVHNYKYESCIIDLKLNIILRKRKITSSFLKIAFVPPIFYSTNVANTNWFSELAVSSCNKTLSLGFDNDFIEIEYTHKPNNRNKYEELYEYLLIPETIANHKLVIGSNTYPVENPKKPTFILKKSGVEYEWVDANSVQIQLANGRKELYRIYFSPNMYMGNLKVAWKIIF